MSRPRDTSGYSDRQSGIRKLVIRPGLRTIENIYPEAEYEVELRTSELTSICPKTGLPDFCDLTVRYVPDRFLVEEKSFKLYLNGYRHVGIFQENATNKIFEDLVSALRPRRMKVTAVWNRRGGVGVTVERQSG
jgi:7-cyano-7-deazaguanine reductase